MSGFFHARRNTPRALAILLTIGLIAAALGTINLVRGALDRPEPADVLGELIELLDDSN